MQLERILGRAVSWQPLPFVNLCGNAKKITTYQTISLEHVPPLNETAPYFISESGGDVHRCLKSVAVTANIPPSLIAWNAELRNLPGDPNGSISIKSNF